MMKHRIIALILAVIMIFGMIPAVSAADVSLVTDSADVPEEVVTETRTDASEPAEEPAEEPEPAPTEEATEAVPEKADIAATAASYPEVTGISPTKNGLKLTWTAVDGSYQYFVFIQKAGGGWKKLGSTASTSYEHKNLTNNTTYVYTVRAADKNGKFTSAYYTAGYPFRYLETPKLVSTASTTTGQKLTWNAVEGATSYKVYIRTDGKWVSAGTTASSYCINTRVTSGKSYTYTVRCWDPDIKKPLSYYETKGISGTFIAAPKITSLNATPTGVTISWDKVDGASYYALFYKTASGWKRLTTTASTSYSHTSLSSGTTYTYTVRCLNSSKQFNSAYYSAGWKFTPTTPPELTSISFRNDQYILKWKAVAEADAYRVFRKEYGAAKWKIIGNTDDTTFTDTTAEKTGVYTYTVRGLDSDNNYSTHYINTDKYYCMGLFIIGPDGTGKPNTTPRYTCEVTEDDLRTIVAKTAIGWIGAIEGDSTHADILAYYNTYVPLAVDYTMQVHDAWCAAFTSAVWIRTGLAPYICTECGCGRFIDEAEARDIWVEADDYVPKVGDAIIYYWSDSGTGECTSGADHIGIVTSVNGNKFVVTEGNTGDGEVATHDRVVDQQYIRGYITPNYKQIARYLSLKAQHI